jgi:hypothetical protein
MSELIMIKRSTSSVLLRNSEGDTTSMRSMMPIHEVKTVELSYLPEEEVEAQWVHRAHARYGHVDPLLYQSECCLRLDTEHIPRP